MNENINIVDDTSKPLELTMDYVLRRIDCIMKDNSHIHEAINGIICMDVNERPGGAGSEIARSEAISNAVQSRETTNQQLIKLLEKMYDDIKPKELDTEVQVFKGISEILKVINPDEYSPEILEVLKKSVQQMFVKPGTHVV